MIGLYGNIDIIAIHPKKETINRMYGCVCARVLKQLNHDVDNNYDAITAGFFFICLPNGGPNGLKRFNILHALYHSI